MPWNPDGAIAWLRVLGWSLCEEGGIKYGRTSMTTQGGIVPECPAQVMIFLEKRDKKL
ncbi:hypothetical protein GCM10022398_31320 [Acetobacter lovaniensis]